MKIHCIAGGYERYQQIKIPLGGTLVRNEPDPMQVASGKTRVYTFERNERMELVGEVDKPADIVRLLSLRHAYRPYGEEAIAQAKADYAWSEEAPQDVATAKAASGQPPVVDEILDDDDDTVASEGYTGEDDDDTVPPADPSVLLKAAAEVPADDADGDAWMAWAGRLPGIDNPNDKEQLEEYALQNYGLELDKRAGVLKLVKQIAGAHVAALAAA